MIGTGGGAGAGAGAGKVLVASAAVLFLVAVTLGGRGLWRRSWAARAGSGGGGAAAVTATATAPARPPGANEPLAWTPVDARVEPVYVLPNHLLRFKVTLPAAPPSAAGGGGRPGRAPARARVRFAAPLDGAKVDAYADTPDEVVTLLDGRRVGGDSVELALPPLPIRDLDVTVHHHRRPVPVVAEVSVGR